MPVISVEILKIIDERESRDTRCLVMIWSSCKVSLTQ